MTKTVIVLLLAAIVAALFFGAYFMLKDKATNDNRRTVRALTWRVGLQVSLILFLVLAYFMGWLQPHGVQGP